MNLHLSTPSLRGALATYAMTNGCMTADIAAMCGGVRVRIDSATDAQVWAARCEAATIYAGPGDADELLVIAAGLREWKRGAAIEMPAADCLEDQLTAALASGDAADKARMGRKS